MDPAPNNPSTVDSAVCSHENRTILSTYTKKNGDKTRSYACKDCGHKWRDSSTKPKLTEQQVLEILATSHDIGHTELAQRYGVSRETVRQIRMGMLYKRLNPSTYAGPLRYCSSCLFFDYQKGCGMQFPDYAELGPIFATECQAYATRNDL